MRELAKLVRELERNLETEGKVEGECGSNRVGVASSESPHGTDLWHYSGFDSEVPCRVD